MCIMETPLICNNRPVVSSELFRPLRAGNTDSGCSGRKSSDFQIYRYVAEMPLVGAYMVSRNSQPVDKKSPANVKSMGI